jgi:hypothetical protein
MSDEALMESWLQEPDEKLYETIQLRAVETVRGIESPSDKISLGKRIVRRWEVALHALICSSEPEAQQYRTQLMDRFAIGQQAVGIWVVALLGKEFGLQAAVAMPVGALLVRLVFYVAGKPTYNELCETWTKRLS